MYSGGFSCTRNCRVVGVPGFKHMRAFEMFILCGAYKSIKFPYASGEFRGAYLPKLVTTIGRYILNSPVVTSSPDMNGFWTDSYPSSIVHSPVIAAKASVSKKLRSKPSCANDACTQAPQLAVKLEFSVWNKNVKASRHQSKWCTLVQKHPGGYLLATSNK